MKPFQFWRLGLLLAIALGANAAVAATAEPGRDRPAPDAAGQSILVFIGTYTGPKSHGIYRFRFDRSTATPSAPELAAETESPSFLAIHPNKRFLYAVGEVATFSGKPSGAVTAFSIDPKTGNLTRLNAQASGGPGPCYVVADKAGKNVLVANYTGGSVAVLPIADNGQLSPATSFIQHRGKGANPQRQEGPHAHSINLDRDGRFAIAADLGLDELLVYRFDAARGVLEPNDPPFIKLQDGAGPRHFTFLPASNYAYVINEMQSSVTALRYDPAKGVFHSIATVSTLPADFHGDNTTAEVQAHPSGRFVYGSNRGHDSIAVFRVNPGTGELQPIQHQSTQGKVPRNFGIDPSGHYLLAANQNSDNVVIFRIDQQSGRLTPTGKEVAVPSPVCVKFLGR